MPVTQPTVDSLRDRFDNIVESEFRGQTRVVVPRGSAFEAIAFLKEERGFDLLVDLTCIDYLNYRDAEDRFGLAYLLANTSTDERLTVRVMLNEPDLTVVSIVPLYEGANWMEREAWDMFGIVFDGHPDLRRILMPEEFSAHPLRKDYPLQGRGERHNFPVLTRGEA
ncbi:MAG: NADH-quinone oxidoreductase subunit C [Planctomycetaceae bacterium]|nr:NADH-quinone oxidoreductase subunit C [Planctomycetaceae bacterium]